MCHNQAAAAPHITGSTWLNAGTGFHGTAAKSDLTNCQGCHGTPGTINFNGGSAPTACSTCHTASKAHPTDWQGLRTINGVTITHRTSGNRDVACAICHNTAGSGTGPDPSAPSCSSANFTNELGQARSCHPGGVSHSVPFLAPPHTTADAESFATSCSSCHAVTGVSPDAAAPLCTVCHQSAATLPFTNCTSCHARPPSGTVYPDVAGSHAGHDALANVTGVCASCHDGLGSGTAGHYDRANARPGKDALRVPPGDVAFLEEYNAKSGAAAFTAANRTCSNVICHGGQETPDWQTATANAIDVPNACLSCHISGDTQFNSYFSGRHDSHIAEFGLSAATCKRCHDETKVNVSGHFQDLATPAFEQPARETILPAVEYKGNSCDPEEGDLTGCHGREDWLQ
jgi:predicted CxxxxCH...CXXCH cytochrome family protein